MHFDISSFLRRGAIISMDRDTVLVGYGARRWLAAPTNLSFFFPTFFLYEPKQWFEHDTTLEIPLKEFAAAIDAFDCGEAPVERTWKSTSRDSFEKTVEELHDLFKKGELVKAVPYIREESEQGVSLGQLVRSLRQVIDCAGRLPVYAYGFWEEDSGMLGATPEILFRIHNSSNLETMACAGTRQRGPDEELIAEDPKELHEHQLVVDDIRTSLSPYGKVMLKSQYVAPFNRLVHLITPIQLVSDRPIAFEEIVKAMHPTAALGAMPREAGSEWLFDYAHMVEYRERFGAPAGYIKDGNGLCLVAIRGMQWRRERVSVYAGCGVVSDSTADREWAELQLKLKSIREVLAL